jgi:hypothetical protein
MDIVSYIEYLIYLGVVFTAGFVVGYFWDRVMRSKDDV